MKVLGEAVIWEISAVCFDRVRFHRFFMGGVLGALLSYGVSIIVHRFVSMSDMMGMSGNSIQIPFYGWHLQL